MKKRTTDSKPQMIHLCDAPPIKTVVRRDGQGNVDFCQTLHDGKDIWGYWIKESEIKTRRGLIRWIDHLATRQWITGQHIRQLIRISNEIACDK